MGPIEIQKSEYFENETYKFYMKQKITHMWRRWHTPQNFFLVFIDELEKQLFIKKHKIFNIYNIVIFLKNKKMPGNITVHLCNKNLDDLIYSSLDI